MGAFEMYPTVLYHEKCPKGRVFTDQVFHDNALKQGWKTSPGAIHDKEIFESKETSYPKKKSRKKK